MKTVSGKKKKGTGGTKHEDTYPEDSNPSSPASISHYNAGPVVASDGESDDGQMWCICRGPDDGRKMINCDGCRDWFHLVCLKIPDHMGDLIRDFYCPKCTDYSHRTMYHPHCTLKNCMKPARSELYPAGNWKFCSDAHGNKYAERTIELARKDEATTRGGVITQGELLAMLEQTNSLEEFRRLGRKPKFHKSKNGLDTIPPPKAETQIKQEHSTNSPITNGNHVVESIEDLLFNNSSSADAMDIDTTTSNDPPDLTPLHIRGGNYSETMDDDHYSDPSQWDHELLNPDEQVRMSSIATQKEAYLATQRLYKLKSHLLDTLRERNITLLANAKSLDSSYRTLCAFPSYLAMNEDQFAAFTTKYPYACEEVPEFKAENLGEKAHLEYQRDDGMEEFHSICMRRKCVKHGDWYRMFKEDARYQGFLAKKWVVKLEREEADIREVAQVRALREE